MITILKSLLEKRTTHFTQLFGLVKMKHTYTVVMHSGCTPHVLGGAGGGTFKCHRLIGLTHLNRDGGFARFVLNGWVINNSGNQPPLLLAIYFEKLFVCCLTKFKKMNWLRDQQWKQQHTLSCFHWSVYYTRFRVCINFVSSWWYINSLVYFRAYNIKNTPCLLL